MCLSKIRLKEKKYSKQTLKYVKAAVHFVLGQRYDVQR